MTAETAPEPERQARSQGGYQQMVRYGIVLAAVMHMVLHDRQFHVAVITGALGAVALARLGNQARPVRRAVHWYNKMGASQELALEHQLARQELARAGQALEAGQRSYSSVRPGRGSNGTGRAQIRGMAR